MTTPKDINDFREHVENTYDNAPTGCGGSFGEILCFELHDQPVNSRFKCKTHNDGFSTGLTFIELAQKWGITVSFLGELIADHCRKLERPFGGGTPDGADTNSGAIQRRRRRDREAEKLIAAARAYLRAEDLEFALEIQTEKGVTPTMKSQAHGLVVKTRAVLGALVEEER